jgi:hypothetical protein
MLHNNTTLIVSKMYHSLVLIRSINIQLLVCQSCVWALFYLISQCMGFGLKFQTLQHVFPPTQYLPHSSTHRP